MNNFELTLACSRFRRPEGVGRLTAVDKAVLVTLGAYYNDGRGYAYPSVKQIADAAWCDRKSVMESISRLEKAGLITVVRIAGCGNRYRLSSVVWDTSTENGTSPESGTSTKNGTAPVPNTVPDPSQIRDTKNKEKKEEKNTNTREGSLELYGLPPALVSDWRSSRKGALTQTAVDGLKREAEKAGLSLEEALRIQLERGWSYFDGVRYRDSLASSSAAPAVEPASAPAASKKEFAGDPDEATRRYLAEHAALNVPYRSQTPEDLEAIRRQKEAEEEERDAEAIFGKRLNGGAK